MKKQTPSWWPGAKIPGRAVQQGKMGNLVLWNIILDLSAMLMVQAEYCPRWGNKHHLAVGGRVGCPSREQSTGTRIPNLTGSGFQPAVWSGRCDLIIPYPHHLWLWESLSWKGTEEKHSSTNAGRCRLTRSCKDESKKGNFQRVLQDEFLVRSVAEVDGGNACFHFFTNIWWEPEALTLLGIPKNKTSC